MTKKNLKIALLLSSISILALIFVAVLFMKNLRETYDYSQKPMLWNVQSIDSVKYSRDVAREKVNDPSYEQVIEEHVSAIASTGATHIAIGTPYNEEFIPFMKRWVDMARDYKLNVWFRGNVAGWEGWFGYRRIDREQHTKETVEFILANGDLFKDGDIFSACPECENGGPGDPRLNGDTLGHRKFLIDEYTAVRDAFRKVDKNVSSNFNPMNGDVAKLIMDKETTKALGGFVVVDHYVRTPEQTALDTKHFADLSGGKVILGEFGAPIPDIHGDMSQEEQAQWLDETLKLLSEMPEVYGVNYWTSHGGSTKLWNDDGSARLAVETLRKYFSPNMLLGEVTDETGKAIKNVEVKSKHRVVSSDNNGNFAISTFNTDQVSMNAEGFKPRSIAVNGEMKKTITLEKTDKNLLYRLKSFFRGN